MPNPQSSDKSGGGVARPVIENQDELIARFVDAGQRHVFAAWDRLGQLERQNLLSECQQFDVDLINSLYKNLVANPQPSVSKQGPDALDTVEQESLFSKTNMSSYERSVNVSAGNNLIRQGKVGVVILAGSDSTVCSTSPFRH